MLHFEAFDFEKGVSVKHSCAVVEPWGAGTLGRASRCYSYTMIGQFGGRSLVKVVVKNGHAEEEEKDVTLCRMGKKTIP